MSKTLADMNSEESQECIGMWVDCNLADITAPLIFQGWASSGHPILMDIGGGQFSTLATRVTPRFDLPRAWNPDGTPPKGEWVNGHMWWNEPGDDSQTVDLIGAECLGTGEIQGMDKWPENIPEAKTTDDDIPVRRFITEWEESK